MLRFLSMLSLLLVTGCGGVGPLDSELSGDSGDSLLSEEDASVVLNPAAPADAGAPSSSDSGTPGDASNAAVEPLPDAGTPAPPEGGVEDCPEDQHCVASFPFQHAADTAALVAEGRFDRYPCKQSADESGPEVVYRVDLAEDGFLSAAVYDEGQTDVDVHILSALEASSCIDRGDRHARAHLSAGRYFVVVDTYVSGGDVKSGPYRVEIGFLPPSRGACSLEVGEMPRVGDGGVPLQLPATGPVVHEAHLVTQEEPPPYPSSAREGIEAHYALSQERSGLVMVRDSDWAPMEGGSFHGAGIRSPTRFPVLDEAWYVCMYWRGASRPAPGTRMIISPPDSPHAVVVAAGYETGPGNLENIGGVTEETHFVLGTHHKSIMTLGIARDQTLPLGLRRCD